METDKQVDEEFYNLSCTKEEILNNKCTDRIINNEQIKEVFNQIKEDLFNHIYKDENRIIITKNALFQVSTLEQQKFENNPNISSIDFGECENILKNKYNISSEESINIVKLDIKSEDFSTIFVLYELYNSNSTHQLSLDSCKNSKVILNIPKQLEKETFILYDNLNKNGYDLFNINDSYYNDICSTYTTLDKTDILLNDRQEDYFIRNGNITLCQIHCKYKFYNLTNNKSKCECDIQTELIETNIPKINFQNNIIENFFLNPITNSNFKVLKCYKLAFDFNDFSKNIGRIMMSIIYFIFLLFMLYYIIKEKTKIRAFIQLILKKYYGHIENKMKINKMVENEELKNNPPKKNGNGDKINNKINNNININNSSKRYGFVNSGNDLLNHNESQLQNDEIAQNNINIVVIKKYYGKIKKSKKKDGKKSKIKRCTNGNIKIYNIKKEKSKNKKKNINKENDTKNIKNKKFISKEMNDYEKNHLYYEKALIHDKRTYCNYYWSLLKTKHLILFTFLPANDYNLFSLKICTFLISFSLYFNINCFFFRDKTMHKIYIDKGKYNIVYQIPQVLYSLIISVIFNSIFKLLSLSQKNILSIKKNKKAVNAIKKSKEIHTNINIKFIVFFILGNIFLLFFWYYISCFCAVYINTQIILIKDIFICFLLSMIYPFGLYLLPGILRISALKAKNKDQRCLYKLSLLLAAM